MNVKLRPMQREDADFLKALDSGACFNQQRTGKTPVILTVIKERNFGRTLVVCPASMCYIWRDEWMLWRGTNAYIYAGTEKQQDNAFDAWTTLDDAALIVSYDMLRVTQKRTHGLRIKSAKIDCMILDESHRIKNHKLATAKTILSFRTRVPHKYILSGTPTTNNPDDIFTQLQFLYPKVYTSYWRFVEEHMEFETGTNWRTGDSWRKPIAWKLGHERLIQETLAEFSTNRKRMHNPDMPWIVEEPDVIPVRLKPTRAQLMHLSELREYWSAEHLEVKNVLERLIRYRQICLDPALLDLTSAGSPKLAWILEYMKDYPDKPILIFSNFTSYIDILSRKYGWAKFTGKMPKKDRMRAIQQFQSGQRNVLLLNVKAAKEGITLDRAEVEIFLDEFPPVGEQQQAQDRFIATTQERADKEHTIYRLLLRGTYEEDIHQMLAQGAETTDITNSFAKYLNIGG